MIITPETLTACLNEVAETPPDGTYELVIRKVEKHQTRKQQNSLHLWLRQMATKMNDSGITSRKLFASMREGFEVPISEYELKKITNIVSKDRYNKTTSELTTKETQELYEIMNNAFGRTTGVSLPFPQDNPPLPE